MTGHHFVTVSVFCLLCATHSPCESHSTTLRTSENLHHLRELLNHNEGMDPLNQPVEHSPHTRKPPNDLIGINRLISIENKNKIDKIERKRDVLEDTTNLDNEYLSKIFFMFGDGNSMTIEGFKKLMDHLDKNILSDNLHMEENNINKTNNKENDTCLHSEEMKSILFPQSEKEIYVNDNKLVKVCPAILYSILFRGNCDPSSSDPYKSMSKLDETEQNIDSTKVWLFSTLAIVLISACGVLGLAIIPLMRKRFYQPLLQFLVALAVGTLSGDALLHLLPHSMAPHHHDNDEVGGDDHHDHGENVWQGFAAMVGLIFLFFMESALNFISEWRRSRQRKDKVPSRVRVVRESESNLASASCDDHHHHKKASFCNYCVCEKIAARVKEGPSKHNGMFEENFWQNGDPTSAVSNCNANDEHQEFIHEEICPFHKQKLEANQNHTECPNDSHINNCSNVNKMVPIRIGSVTAESVPEEYTVILREHETKHHGHSHRHGHVHSAPNSLSSVAWMVIMGDGLHNFTDGMAIGNYFYKGQPKGAAFAGSLTGGFSTTVAVLCHELPHEIGDFAVLLKAGMSMKQALLYNLLSSLLCLVGNAFGVWLGHNESGSRFLFAITAGMFLYIALVDMIPELSSGQNAMASLFQPLLQILGLFTGLSIMTLIALYEHDLKKIFYVHND